MTTLPSFFIQFPLFVLFGFAFFMLVKAAEPMACLANSKTASKKYCCSAAQALDCCSAIIYKQLLFSNFHEAAVQQRKPWIAVQQLYINSCCSATLHEAAVQQRKPWIAVQQLYINSCCSATLHEAAVRQRKPWIAVQQLYINSCCSATLHEAAVRQRKPWIAVQQLYINSCCSATLPQPSFHARPESGA